MRPGSEYLCPNCTVSYYNAGNDASKQASQVQDALTAGAKVLVLDAVDPEAAGALVDQAKAKNVPVIAYDRLIRNTSGLSYYVGFDDEAMGKMEAQALVDALQQARRHQSEGIVMLQAPSSDSAAAALDEGAHSVFDPLVQSGELTLKDFDLSELTSTEAQDQAEAGASRSGRRR